MKKVGETTHTIDSAVGKIVEHCAGRIVLATPLGLGKPNILLNALYRRAEREPKLQLHIYTALSLARPQARSDLERRFLEPFLERHFGKDYPDLAYLQAIRADTLPPNVHVSEFYFQSGSMLGALPAQRAYTSLNYTHVARAMAEVGVNVIAQLVARRDAASGPCYSLSSNPDVTLDLLDLIQANGQQRPMMVGVDHCELPFLAGDAEVPADFFDLIVDDKESPHRLFALPREPVTDAEFALGLHASALIRDGGTLQIGIGALSDALVYATLLRHQSNPQYLSALTAIGAAPDAQSLSARIGGVDRFERGLYGASEMVMDGFMHLVEAGIVSRRVYDDVGIERAVTQGVIGEDLRADSIERLWQAGALGPRLDATELARLQSFGLLPAQLLIDAQGNPVFGGERINADLSQASARNELGRLVAGRRLIGGHYLHGAFYLGSTVFYQWLRNLGGAAFDGLCMTRVSHINELYGGAERLQAEQRRDARFFNTCMMMTLLGAGVSDALESGQVVSGVGGQYNFVAMAHALRGGRSVLMLRSTRSGKHGAESNLLWNYGHTTIPRHLRDVVVTEYGCADLRGKSDEDTIKALLAITDSRFQDSLVERARHAGKLARDFVVPDAWRRNTPAQLSLALQPFKSAGLFARFPFGSDFDPDELRLIAALGRLKSATATLGGKIKFAFRALLHGHSTQEVAPLLQRMDLSNPRTLQQRFTRRLLALALRRE